MPVKEALHQDALRYGSTSNSLFGFFQLCLKRRGFRVTALYRISRICHSSGFASVGKLIQRVAYHSSHCEINPRADIAGGLLLPHPVGIVIGGGVVLGRECTIQQNVTIGGNYGKIANGRDMPLLEDFVSVSVGAVVAGPVRVGEKSVIGANAVVTRDVLAGSTVAAHAPTLLTSRLGTGGLSPASGTPEPG